MYESPIELVYHETFPKLIKQQEDLIMRGCLDVGVYVDKEELIKALKYDREQYQKGYEDGRPQKGEWVDGYYGVWCSVCKQDHEYRTPYCPFCGADMRGGTNENGKSPIFNRAAEPAAEEIRRIHPETESGSGQ